MFLLTIFSKSIVNRENTLKKSPFNTKWIFFICSFSTALGVNFKVIFLFPLYNRSILQIFTSKELKNSSVHLTRICLFSCFIIIVNRLINNCKKEKKIFQDCLISLRMESLIDQYICIYIERNRNRERRKYQFSKQTVMYPYYTNRFFVSIYCYQQ